MQAATNTMLCSSVSLNNPKKKPRRRSCDSMPHFAAKCHGVFWALACRSAPTLMTWAAQSKNKTKHESVTQALGRAIYWQGWALQYCKENFKGGCTESTEWLESHVIKSESGVLPVRWVQTKVEVSCYYCYYETSDTSSSSRDSLKTWMFILFSKWIQRHLSYGVLSFSETVYLDFLWYARTKDHSWPPNSFWSYISWRSTYRNSSAVWSEFPFILWVTLKSFYYFHAFLVRLQSAVSYHKTEK